MKGGDRRGEDPGIKREKDEYNQNVQGKGDE